MRGTAFARTFPHFPLFVMFFAMITIERAYTYSRAVSQRHMIWRDLLSTTVQAFVAGAVMAALVLRVLHFIAKSSLVRGSLLPPARFRGGLDQSDEPGSFRSALIRVSSCG